MPQVVLEPSLSVDDLVDGLEMHVDDFGLVSLDGSLGSLIVEIVPIWVRRHIRV